MTIDRFIYAVLFWFTLCSVALVGVLVIACISQAWTAAVDRWILR